MALIVEQRLIAELSQEKVVLMSAFGAEHHLYIPLSKAAERDALITAETALVDTKEAEFRAYALEHYGQAEVDKLLAQGALIIAARKARNT